MQLIFQDDQLLSELDKDPFIVYEKKDNTHVILLKKNPNPKPFYILHQSNTNIQIIAEEKSVSTLIESLIPSPTPLKTHTHIELKKEATLNHIILQNLTKECLYTGELTLFQNQASHYLGSLMISGGQSNKLSIAINLNAAEAFAEFEALTIAKGNQQIEVQLYVNHHHPHCTSRIVSRGIIADKAKGNFMGKILVSPNAKKTKSKLENKNLLLSLDAQMNTSPQLEVYNDDVQCSHGATVGHLESDALFYLRSRGFSEKEAKQMLIKAFMSASLTLHTPLVLGHLERLIDEL